MSHPTQINYIRRVEGWKESREKGERELQAYRDLLPTLTDPIERAECLRHISFTEDWIRQCDEMIVRLSPRADRQSLYATIRTKMVHRLNAGGDGGA